MFTRPWFKYFLWLKETKLSVLEIKTSLSGQIVNLPNPNSNPNVKQHEPFESKHLWGRGCVSSSLTLGAARGQNREWWEAWLPAQDTWTLSLLKLTGSWLEAEDTFHSNQIIWCKKRTVCLGLKLHRAMSYQDAFANRRVWEDSVTPTSLCDPTSLALRHPSPLTCITFLPLETPSP